MSRYIDADALKRYIPTRMDMQDLYLPVHFKTLIDEQPTVDAVTVVHGHWEIVPNDDNRDDHYKMRCSVCGETLWSIHSEELYCCKCGAKMDDYDDGERRSDEDQHIYD